MKKYLCFLLVLFLIVLSSCAILEPETPMTKEEARKAALTCFEKYKEDMDSIIQSNAVSGKTKWCKYYGLLKENNYEFVLQQTGFTDTNTATGILYDPDDTPDIDFIQDEGNQHIYSYESGYTDKFYLERIEQNYFFFHYTYDF